MGKKVNLNLYSVCTYCNAHIKYKVHLCENLFHFNQVHRFGIAKCPALEGQNLEIEFDIFKGMNVMRPLRKPARILKYFVFIRQVTVRPGII